MRIHEKLEKRFGILRWRIPGVRIRIAKPGSPTSAVLHLEKIEKLLKNLSDVEGRRKKEEMELCTLKRKKSREDNDEYI